MRIVAGKHKGRVLQAPKGRDTRPTSDRTRGALFNILEHGFGEAEIERAMVLDVFAGTGALGLEALSRGAQKATFMETAREALKCLSHNIASLKEEDNTQIFKLDATRPRPAPQSHSMVFLDPPYGKGLVPKALTALASQGWISPGALCIAEETSEEDIVFPGDFELLDKRKYGAAQVAFARFTG